MFNLFLAATTIICVMGATLEQTEAMDVEQCLSATEMKQKLNEEGQQYVAIANEPVIDQDKEKIRVFTSNSTGTNGYVLSGDQPRALVSSQFCVSLRYKDVKIFDANEPGVNSGALVKTENSEIARRQCEHDKGTCSLHSTTLAAQAKNGRRVMMQATLMHRQRDGTYSPGNLLTLTGQMEGERRGTLGYTSSVGAYTIVTPFDNVTYGPYALKILEKQQH
jgi:hypothetical protein